MAFSFDQLATGRLATSISPHHLVTSLWQPSKRQTRDCWPTWSSYGAGFEDQLAYWHGEVDEERLAELIHGLALVETWKWRTGPERQNQIDEW